MGNNQGLTGKSRGFQLLIPVDMWITGPHFSFPQSGKCKTARNSTFVPKIAWKSGFCNSLFTEDLRMLNLGVCKTDFARDEVV